MRYIEQNKKEFDLSDIGAETPAGAQTKVDTHNQTRKAHGIGYAASITAAGWYRIASNGPVAAGRTGGNRAFAKFTVQDKTSGRHKAIVFYAGYHYGNQPTIVLLGNSKYGGTGRITKIRLIEGSTYEGAAVEVYIDGSATVEFQITENFQDNGWIAVNWEAGSIPTGFTVTQLDLDTIGDPVFAIACDNQNNMFYVARNGETYVQNNKIWHAGNDGAGSGLDADTVDGKHASDFGSVPEGATIYGKVGFWALEGGFEIISQFASPSTGPASLAWDGTYLWHADDTADQIYKLNTSGTIISQFASLSTAPAGLAWDGTYLWHADVAAAQIYKMAVYNYKLVA
jgi:hypothetical protein